MRLRACLALASIASLAAAASLGLAETRPASGAAKAWRPAAVAAPVKTRPSYLPDTTVMIRFDGQPVTAGEVMAAYYNGYPPDLPKADSLGRAEFLNSIVQQRVLGALARDVDPPVGFEDRMQLRQAEERAISNELYIREVRRLAVADTAEARDWYEQCKTDHHLRVMTIAERATAERIRANLVNRRMSWAQAYLVAERGVKRPNLGDLGWVTRLNETDWLPEAAYRLGTGEYAPLYLDVGGWNLVQCVETRAVKLVPFHVIARPIFGTLRQSKLGIANDALTQMLRSRIHVSYDTTNVVWLADRFAEGYSRARGKNLSLGRQLPGIAPQDSGRVLARWDGGSFSVNGFMHAYDALPPVTRVLVDTPVRLRRQLDASILEPLRVVYARERGYDKLPEVIAEVAKARERIMVERIYRDSVESQVRVTAEMLRQYYDANLASFMTYPRVDYAAILSPRKSEADSIAARLRAGVRAEQILREDSLAGLKPRGRMAGVTQDQSGAPFYFTLFEELKPGEITELGPDESGQVMVLQSLGFDAGRQLSFEESASMADASVRNAQAERLLTELVARHRGKHTVEWHPEWVMRVDWRDPTLDQ